MTWGSSDTSNSLVKILWRKKPREKFTQLWNSLLSHVIGHWKKKNQANSAFNLDREEERAEESEDSNLSDAGADCRDRMLMEWSDQDFCWMSDGTNKCMWTEYKKKRLQERNCQCPLIGPILKANRRVFAIKRIVGDKRMWSTPYLYMKISATFRKHVNHVCLFIHSKQSPGAPLSNGDWL